MAKKSTKSKKNIYQQYRENLGLSREQASDVVKYLSPERIERIENGKTAVHPEDVIWMAEGYRALSLCNYYCSQECPIGKHYFPSIESKELSQIVLELLSLLKKINARTDRLIDIAKGNHICEDDLEDFVSIQQSLSNFSATVSNLDLWTRQEVITGHINKETYDSLRSSEADG